MQSAEPVQVGVWTDAGSPLSFSEEVSIPETESSMGNNQTFSDFHCLTELAAGFRQAMTIKDLQVVATPIKPTAVVVPPYRYP